MRERRSAALATFVVVATTAFLFWPVLLGAITGAPRWFEWDVPEQYWPDLVYVCRSLHAGALPYWNPWDRGGYPFYADPQAAPFHPLTWGICVLGGASPGLGWASLRVVVGFIVAGLFSLPWLRRLGASWPAATLGAVVIECAPFMRHNWELDLTLALGWLPMVLWALERVLQEQKARDAALLALAEALLVWSGSPPVVGIAGGFTLLYLVGRTLEIARADRSALTPLLRLFGLAALLTSALCAVVLVPGLTLAEHSVQAARSYESIAEGGLDAWATTALVWPREGNHLFVGWIALALAPFAFARRPVFPGRVVLASAAVIAVLMAMGDHGPLFRVAFELVPGVRLFRLPHRWEAWLGPAFGALAAGGLDAAWARCQARWPSAKTAQLAAVLALPMLLVLDVTRTMPDDRHMRSDTPPGADASVPHVLAHLTPGARVMDEFGIGARAGTRLRLRELRGYQDPLLLRSFERVIASLRDSPHLLEQLGVRYVLTGPHYIHGWDRHFAPPPDVLRALSGAIDRGDGVIELTHALPAAYVVLDTEVAHVASRQEALARLRALAPAPLAILEDGDAPLPARQAALRPARVLSYRADALEIEATADEDGMLIVNEVWYPGWRATVDGIDAPVVRANGLVRAVPISAGTHRVALTFEPPDGAPLRWVWLAGWLGVVGIAFGSRARR